MRILVVSPFVPFPPDRGHRVRIYWLLRQLSLSHEVGLVTQCFSRAEHDQVEALRRAFPSLHPLVSVHSPAHRSLLTRVGTSAWSRLLALGGFPRERVYHSSWALARATGSTISTWKPDLVQGEYWFSRWAIPLGDAASVWLDSIDLHWLRLQREAQASLTPWRRAMSGASSSMVRRHELRAYGDVGRVLAVQEVERGILQDLLPSVPVSTVPIATEVPPRLPARRHGPAVLFVGALDYAPNRDALRFLARAVFPLLRQTVPEAELRVVGRLANPRSLPQAPWIRYLGHVARLEDALEGVGASVAPLRMGAGTSVKALSSLGFGLPLVASARAVEGLPLEPFTHYVPAETPAEGAAGLARLLRDPSFAQRIGRGGYEVARSRFDWRATASSVAATYEEGMRGGRVLAATDERPSPAR